MIDTKIIKIASNTKYAGLKNIYTHKSSLKNSLCGDKIKLELVAKNSKIDFIRYETESCILCEASASLLANKIKLYPIKNLKKDIIMLKKMINKRDFDLPGRFKKYKDLLGSKNLSRNNCIILPLNALLKAFKI